MEIVLLRGGGDLASGVALRLFRAGIMVVITELSEPLAVRRTVSFSEAVYDREVSIEGIVARLVTSASEVRRGCEGGVIPVLIDPGASCRKELSPIVIVDGRMTKQAPDLALDAAPMMIGLGPGFDAGKNCHAVVETRRGSSMGRVIWQGPAEPDTGLPDSIAQYQSERVLRAPVDGKLTAHIKIGDHLQASQLIAEVAGKPVRALFPGILRGLLKNGMLVRQNWKIGDLDPRDDPRLVRYVSDKSLAVGGGVLEAILSRLEIRSRLW